MRNRLTAIFAVASLPSLFLSNSPLKAADPEPTVAQIYQASRVGHLDQAQQMMDRVLRAHPNSWKAHYVQAELYAKEGHPDLARSELARAEQLKPGLPDVTPRSVQRLRAKLGLAAVDSTEATVK
jgi:uncharacterized protein